MKIFSVLLVLSWLGSTSALYAQAAPNRSTLNSAELGVFFEDTRLAHTRDTNFWGGGARLAFNASQHVQVEAEASYDFAKSFDNQINVSLDNTNVEYERASARVLHGLVGPKFNLTGSGPVRLYVTVKGGFINFSGNRNLSTQINHIADGDTDAVFYPAAGLELFSGPFGIRFEAGDEVYFNHGQNQSPRFSFGPELRF